ncbi:cupin domain-containing protein [Candidatus Peregrinibacteria bacterium]|nr:cupin domain-containing protein [Candidatus Peregrinibacteria bacterium]
MAFHTNIIEVTRENENFRKVVFTGKKSQLVVMSLLPGVEIGAETHEGTEQTLIFLSGKGKAVIDGVESEVKAGDVYVITPGEKHNFINNGEEPLKIYTVYAPANHLDGRVHATKEAADADQEDEDFGHRAK